MALYDNVGGVVRKVKKKYDNMGGVVRKVLKCYDNVAGVARQYFGSDTTYSGIKSVEIIEQNIYENHRGDGACVTGISYDDVPQYGQLVASFGFYHTSCFAQHDFYSQYVQVNIDVTVDDNGKITGFPYVSVSVEPYSWTDDASGEYFEEHAAEVEALNGDTAFEDGYLDVKTSCVYGCCDATVRITFE